MAARRQDVFCTRVVPELDMLLRVARSLTGQDADAEELVKETLRQAFDAIERFDGRHPRTWLLTTMRHVQLGHSRRQKPGRVELASEVVVSADHPYDSAVCEALGRLPPGFRKPVELVDLHGLRYQEAAAALGVPLRTVRRRLHRARRRMREDLNASRQRSL